MSTLDLTKIAPKARERYIRLGRRYGSDDTFKQATKTLQAIEIHAAELVDRGFGTADGLRLAGARDALGTAGFGRETKVTEKKTTRKDYVSALSQAKTGRYKARTILGNTLIPLGDDGHEGAVHKVEATLSQTNSLPIAGQDEALAAQLDLLAVVLADSTVATATQSRGGPKVLVNLQQAAVALRAASEERETTGTRLSTEEMDLIDGIIVTLCRAARNAAKQAANELARPALLADFALSHIADHRGPETIAPETTPATPGSAPTP
jgi:hypothetical protein